MAVVPARPYKPKDKSKAEVGVQIVERWILARLHHHTFFSLAELNQCIRALLEDLNQKPFKQLPGNRKSAFEALDKPALNTLPRHPYRYVNIKPVKVNVDYPVQYQQHHYSVPHQYVGERLELHASDRLITLYFHQQAVPTHVRTQRAGMTTEPAHMPTRHRKQQQWTPGRLKNWARDIGPSTLAWVDAQLSSKRHPEQAYRVCLGLLNLSRAYPPARLEAACRVANHSGLIRLEQVGTYEGLAFSERLALFVEQETLTGEHRKQERLIRQARFKLAACVADIDYQHRRNMKKAQIARLTQPDWIERDQNLLITGPCGSGKTYLACALGHNACLHGDSVRYYRLSRLLLELTQSKADGSYHKELKKLARTRVLIIDLCAVRSYVE